MSNPFDQFDAPAAPTRAANPFDQFDHHEAAAPAAPEKPSTALDVAKSAGVGLGRGVIGALGLAGDARDAIGNASEYALQRLAKMSGAAPAGAQPQSYADIAAGNRKLADAVQLPGGADITRAVEAGTGKFPEPQTTAGRYAETIGEFAPSAAIGGGGLLRKAAEAVLPAVASQGAGELTKGTAAEPYARVAAGIVGGGGVTGAARLAAPTVDEMIARAAGHLTPEQVTTAQGIKDASTGRGMFLSGPEAIQAATRGATKLGDVQRATEATTAGGGTLAALYAQRPAEVQAAVRAELDRIAPASMNPSEIGPRAQTAAQGVLDDTRQGINAQTRPAYAAAEGQLVSPGDHAVNMANPAFVESLRRLRADPVLGPTYGPNGRNLPDNSIGVLDAVTKDMRDRGVALGNAANPGFSSQTAAAYQGGAADARSMARGQSPAYDDALTQQEELRRTQLNPLERGPVGRIAGIADTSGGATTPLTQRVGDTLLPRNPQAGSEGEIGDAAARLHARDPGVSDDVIRQHLADKLDGSATDLAGGPNQSQGVKFRNLVAGSPQQRTNLVAALGGPNRAQGLSELLDTLQAQSYRKAAGSNTAMDLGSREAMAQPTGLMRAGAAVLNPLSAATHGFGEILAQHAADRNSAALAHLFAAPDSVAQIAALAAAHQHSALADLFARGALQAPAETGSR